MATSTPPSESVVAEVRPGEYGAKVIAVEPGGAEMVPPGDRHGRPINLLWTWLSPNLEFATVFLGVLAIMDGLSFGNALLAIFVGTALGSVAHAFLSARGPRYGVPQMVLSRIGFGHWGNILPAGLNAVIAGIGWFAVNSVSGALALNALLGLPSWLALIIVVVIQIVVAFFGHNLVQAFERYALPFLGLVFLAAVIVSFAKGHYSHSASGSQTGPFLLIVGATFGYAAGWIPYAADYTRYLPLEVSKKATGLYAGLGVFLSCMVLEAAGAASATAVLNPDNPTAAFTGHLGTVLGDLTLLAIALGGISANAINIYSGALSFTALGIKLPLRQARAVVAVVFGVLGFILALTGLHDAGSKYENFLLLISYWVGPWLGVYITDWFLRRGRRVDGFLFDTKHNPLGGWVAMLVGIVVSVSLFANVYGLYIAPIPSHHPAFGDITFFVGFVLAAVLYAVFFPLQRRREPEEAVLVTPEESVSLPT
jgi:NCS1 nucleoside transporter family